VQEHLDVGLPAAVSAAPAKTPVFAINLARATARRAALVASAQAAGVDLQVTTAVDGALLDQTPGIRYSRAHQLARFGRELRQGEIACFASHYRLWQMLRDQPGHDWAVICEDDIQFNADFTQAVAAAQRFAEQHGLSFIRLAGVFNRPYARLGRVNEAYELIRFRKDPLGTQCYLINRHAAAMLIEHAALWYGPVDDYLSCYWRHGLQPYALHPYPVQHTQAAQTSSIQSRREKLRRSVRLRREAYRLWTDGRRLLGNALWALRYALSHKL